MYELFMIALNGTGVKSIGAEKNYVETITSASGNVMSEFTNDPYSGWMYTVDGNHPNLGILEYKINSNCEVIWHYVNDYRYEVHDWFSEEGYPGLGNGSLHSKWRDATKKDVPDSNNPGQGGLGTDTNGGGSSTDDKTTEANTSLRVSQMGLRLIHI